MDSMSVAFRPKSALRNNQLTIVQQMLDHDARLFVLSMGSGKTGAALTAIRYLLDSTEIRRVLVVAPLRVAVDTWPQEIKDWAHTRLLRYAVACGTEAEREAAIAADAEITIINGENLVWLAKHLGSVNRWPYDCVVIDESSRFKNGAKRTKRTKVKGKDGEVKVRPGGNMTRFGVLSVARKKVDRIYLLTGTPAPNGIEDLWGQIYLLDQGERLGRTITAFHERWFNKNRYTHEITPKPGAEEEIMAAVKDVMISFPPQQLVAPPVYVPIRVTLPPKVMREFREFEATLVAESYDVEAVSRGVLANKLLQFANGSMYREDGTVVSVHDYKLRALEELVEEADGENLLVFYGFKFDLEVIRTRYPEAVVLNESPTAVQDWNAGKIKMLLAHPASCAHGLNLQYGGHLCVWYGLTWNLELYQQANARLPRPGQTQQVAIYQIIAVDTYDELVLETLARKDVTQQSVIDSVTLRLRDKDLSERSS